MARKPRNLADYSDAESAAIGLEQLAEELRMLKDRYPLVRWNVNLSYWNPEWESASDQSAHQKKGPR